MEYTENISPNEQKKVETMARKKYQPKKPPRTSVTVCRGSDLQSEQEPCGSHEEPLDLYCSRCRLVVCKICKLRDHGHANHKVLTAPDALSLLRTETVTLLRHYTLLRSMFTTLKNVYRRYERLNANVNQATDDICTNLRLDEEQILVDIVEEAEEVVEKGRSLKEIRGKVVEWEKNQHNWSHIVYMFIRCRLLANIRAANDQMYIRVKEWLLPTPWIHLSHVLHPYLDDSKDSISSPSMSRYGSIYLKTQKDSCLLTISRIGDSPDVPRLQDIAGLKAPETKPFPHNSKTVLLRGLIPYIILNPMIRYFIRIFNYLTTDMTLVVEPSEEHVYQYLSRQRYTATYSPGTLRRSGYSPSDDSLTIVEKMMMMGGKQRSRLVASYSSPRSAGNSPAIPTLVKVSFPDILVVSGGMGLAAAQGGVKRGDIIVDSDTSRGCSIAVVLSDIGDVPALRIGRIVQGLESFKCLIENEEKRKTESNTLRAKIMATVKREEEAIYEITFGIDI